MGKYCYIKPNGRKNPIIAEKYKGYYIYDNSEENGFIVEIFAYAGAKGIIPKCIVANKETAYKKNR